mmetsp:Transcript_11568/g.27742  ORF Transcript_11568/g.27742 Transcript_11568/m.27742 type:complete len:201 (-) Transcript_11568:31-633(-)
MHALLGAGALCRCHKAHIAGRALQKQPDGLLHAEEVLGFLRGAGQALLDLHILGEELVKGGLAALELELLRHAGAEPGGVTVDVVCIELFHSRLALGAGAVVGHGAVGHGLDHRCRSLLDGVRNGRIHQLLGDRAVHKLQALEQAPGREPSHPSTQCSAVSTTSGTFFSSHWMTPPRPFSAAAREKRDAAARRANILRTR